MVRAVKEVRPNYRPNLGCSSCVRSLVLECAGMYFSEKDAMQKALDTAVLAAKTAEIPAESVQTEEDTAPKKKARKTKKNDA